MLIIIIFVAAAVAMAVASVMAQMREEKQKQLFRSQFRQYISDFSTSAYMGRIEKSSVEIMQDAQKRPKYQFVLWAGLDGLRMNDDGTTEWIRREEKPKPVSVSYSLPQSLAWNPAFNVNQMQNVSRETQNQLAILQAQTQNLQFQQWQTEQMQNMISVIQPAYTQSYTPYWQPTYYYAVNQCCVRQ